MCIRDSLWAGLRTDMPDTREGEKLISLPAAFDTGTGVFELGDWWHPVAKEENGDIQEIGMARLSSISPDDRLQLRLHGKGYFFDNARRKHGALMHEVLSRIRTRKDICLLYTSWARRLCRTSTRSIGMLPNMLLWEVRRESVCHIRRGCVNWSMMWPW